MKKISLVSIALTFIVSGLFATATAQELMSLRGHVAADDLSEPAAPKRWQSDREPIPRDYLQQPPLIPHSIEGYKVNLKFNKCLTCHSWSNYRRAGATKISQTHFEDRDENVLANISARRYFCTQCHVPQMDAQPLVNNTFEPVEAIRTH